MDYEPYDHYWEKNDGTFFSSARCIEVDSEDIYFREWVAAGGVASPYPRNSAGAESGEQLEQMLAPLGIVNANESPEKKRRAAYEAEADIFRDEALSYRLEAEAWMLENNGEVAAAAECRFREALGKYLDRKREIRARYPESPADER